MMPSLPARIEELPSDYGEFAVVEYCPSCEDDTSGYLVIYGKRSAFFYCGLCEHTAEIEPDVD